jgi:hypothetical protein
MSRTVAHGKYKAFGAVWPRLYERDGAGLMEQWIRSVMNDANNELRKAADQAMIDLQESTREVAPMEWYWLAVLLLVSAGSWYLMLLGAGQQTGLW